MATPKSKRKMRSDKFPLTLHPTKQYCKKIKGKLYYFGNDKENAKHVGMNQTAESFHPAVPPARRAGCILQCVFG